jgi:hypothetical protein
MRKISGRSDHMHTCLPHSQAELSLLSREMDLVNREMRLMKEQIAEMKTTNQNPQVTWGYITHRTWCLRHTALKACGWVSPISI